MTPTPTDSRPPISAADVRSLLCQIGSDVVLVGGQALSIWAEHYADVEPELANYGPYTSRDVDFRASRADVEKCADRLGTRPDYAAGKAFGSIIEAVITFRDSTDEERTIEFLRSVKGLTPQEVQSTAVEIELEKARIRVMHPVLVLVSRATNVIKLKEKYDNEHGVEQLRVAVFCARAFLKEAMQAGEGRLALSWAERAYRLIKSQVGIRVHVEKQIDLLQAIPLEHMPEKFRSTRYPQMVVQANALREKKTKVAKRT